MAGILLVSHGNLAEGVHNAALMIAGDTEGFDFLGLQPGTTAETFRSYIVKKVKELDTGQGVLILTDIIGGTPFNASCMVSKTENAEVLTGLNLGMAITACLENGSASDLQQLADLVEQAGKDSIRRFKI